MEIKRVHAGVCPRCGSRLTGKLKKGPEGENFLRRGTVTVFTSDNRNYNCACAVCGVKWSGPWQKDIITKEDVESLYEEWKELVEEYGDINEDEILYELVNGEELPQKKEKSRGIIRRGFGFLFKGAISAPIQSIKSLGTDFYEMAGGTISSTRDSETEDEWPQ